MLIRPAVLNFEKIGFGMFVHFGLYSVHGKGEWAKFCLKIDDESYDAARKQFCPKADWAAELVRTAKNAGCRYITLTTRHHDGYSLYDTCGLNEYDTVHDCGRDLVREFVDACRAGGIVPFFYHTLLDWHEKTYQTDFLAYLRYLRSSVELLCRNYGEIGGFWFDGKWNKPDADWEEDALYGMIRRYQPDTIARIRTDYVHEQQARYRTAIADLEARAANASTSERVKLNKQLKTLNDQATEIHEYEEKIHHLADQMISIDLDDGVKVNYAKFQDMLAKIK